MKSKTTRIKAPREAVHPQKALRKRPSKKYARRRTKTSLLVVGLIGGALLVLAVIFFLSSRGGASPDTASAGQYPFQVGSPGPGEQAPPISLPATDGSQFDLATMSGKTTLLYFQEGIGCQPCWDQLKDLEASGDALREFSIDAIVSITTDPLPALKRKVVAEGLTSLVLSDPELSVSRAYTTNQYGMMGESRNGHTFILVGPDGTILWRADYGGAPQYTMQVPVPNLVADMRVGLQSKEQ